MLNRGKIMYTNIRSSSPQPKYHKVNRRFTKEEDDKLRELVKKLGEQNWLMVSSYMKTRNSRQCKDRWFQYLSPNANVKPWTEEEELCLRYLVVELNGRWTEIAKRFPGRSDSQVRNKWRTIQRRLGMLDLDIKDYINIVNSQNYHQNQTQTLTPPVIQNSIPTKAPVEKKKPEKYVFLDSTDIFDFSIFEDKDFWVDDSFEQYSTV